MEEIKEFFFKNGFHFELYNLDIYQSNSLNETPYLLALNTGNYLIAIKMLEAAQQQLDKKIEKNASNISSVVTGPKQILPSFTKKSGKYKEKLPKSECSSKLSKLNEEGTNIIKKLISEINDMRKVPPIDGQRFSCYANNFATWVFEIEDYLKIRRGIKLVD